MEELIFVSNETYYSIYKKYYVDDLKYKTAYVYCLFISIKNEKKALITYGMHIITVCEVYVKKYIKMIIRFNLEFAAECESNI